MRTLLALLLFAAPLPAAETVKVFILAGQSNMVGQAVVDLKGRDYNDGKGTLVNVMARPGHAARYAHLRNPDGSWRLRDDVFVRYERENQPMLKGPMGLGFSGYGDLHHFGPEMQCGHVLGDAFDEPVLIVKCAWGGKSLYQDFRPPSAGGTTGKYYNLMIAQVRAALAEMDKDFPALAGRKPVLTGLVWYQGWNDGVDPKKAIPEYASNLTHLIRDVRRDLAAPALPVVIGELTGAWVDAPKDWENLRRAQASVAELPEFAGTVRFVPTRQFVRDPKDSPNPSHGHHEFGNAETYFLVGDALGQGLLDLVSPLRLTSPSENQVFQRQSLSEGKVTLTGTTAGGDLEFRLRGTDAWKPVNAERSGTSFAATVTLPAGGWHGLEVRAVDHGKVLGRRQVAQVGVGEVFVVAGQSNSANHGESTTQSSTGLVVNFTGRAWVPCADPQPGASGKGGSMMPALGDALAERLRVPVGFVTVGIGATSVREWLPAGVKFPQPPTVMSRVRALPDGGYEADGKAYDNLVARARALGRDGFRAVLWHQGESDANQKDANRTLPGTLYAEQLGLIIRESRRAWGWETPWMVAQVSYHSPDDTGSDDIRQAQASLWKAGLALPGPDSDALRGPLRDHGGKGIHFSTEGLRAHGRAWADKIAPWIEGMK